jgi:hypothetical protein
MMRTGGATIDKQEVISTIIPSRSAKPEQDGKLDFNGVGL